MLTHDQIILGLPSFQNPQLLTQALTHCSYESKKMRVSYIRADNERLEFLGDALLNFLSGEFLYKRYPLKPEGELTPLRSALVEQRQLAQFAMNLNLGPHLRLSRGAEVQGGRTNPNLLSSAFEALIGAYFLDRDSNVDLVRAYVFPLFESVVEELAAVTPQINYKSRLQQWALASHQQHPRYVITQATGPDHAKEFTAEVWIGIQKLGEGTGRRKQEAEKAAARHALLSLGELV
jgi:ribonuclease-3